MSIEHRAQAMSQEIGESAALRVALERLEKAERELARMQSMVSPGYARWKPMPATEPAPPPHPAIVIPGEPGAEPLDEDDGA